ncbi:hypothetical protein SL267_22170 [Serratia marcescens]|nr:hypothetical protein [Serratia marcescens]BCZ57600.1 hypothetical protein SL267_22170 [Serratia marcescens]
MDALANLQALTLPQGDRLQWLYYGSGHASAIKFNQQVVSEFTAIACTGKPAGSRARCSSSGVTTPWAAAAGRAALRPRQTDPAGRRRAVARLSLHRPRRAGWVSDRAARRSALRLRRRGPLLQHREPNQGKPGARLVYDLADNLLGERSPQNDIDAHLLLAPIADNRLTHGKNCFTVMTPGAT